MFNYHHKSAQQRTTLSFLLAVVIVLGSSINTKAMADGEPRTRVQAIDIAKQRSGGDGRVLSVQKKVNKNGVSVFAVKIISNGRVKIYSVREFK